MGFKALYSSKILPVFLSILCDNLLLTVVVPILPELLKTQGLDYKGSSALETKTEESCFRKLLHLHLLRENSQLGTIYSTKAFVQLITNPLVGKLTIRIGFKIPLCVGNFVLLLCSLVYGFANSIGFYTIGRSCHGIASSLISISGMAMIAELYQDDEENRTKYLGRAMGAAALGVLIGYPFGGVAFSLFGKSIPFLVIGCLAASNVALQSISWARMWHDIGVSDEITELNDLTEVKSSVIPVIPSGSLLRLLRDRSILIIVIAVWLTTTAMAVLEPTLPVWLIDNIDPPKWQLGLVFVPDSFGYFLGTNYFGSVALRYGRWKISLLSMAILGVSCFMIPFVRMIWQLVFPHFTLGLALGVVDASMMPLLACVADTYHQTGYGVVYSLAQTSVALAYSFGPFLGGELVSLIGFPDLMRAIGILNLLFCPLLALLSTSEPEYKPETSSPLHCLTLSKHIRFHSFDTTVQPPDNQYQRFHDELDSD